MRPATAFQLSLDHTILGTHGLDDIAVADIDTDMTIVPNSKTGDFRDGVDGAGL